MRGVGEFSGIRRRLAAALLVTLLIGLAAAEGALSRPAVFYPPACQTVTYHSQPNLDAQRVCTNLGVKTHHDPGSYLVITPHDSGVGIFTDTGRLVWWKQHPPGTSEMSDATVVRLWGRQYLAAWAGTPSPIGNNSVQIANGTVLLFNSHYRQVGQITAGPPFSPGQINLHEFRITPQGDALIGIYQPVKRLIPGGSEWVVHFVVQKLSLVRDSHGIHRRRVLFQWTSRGHIPLSQSYEPDPGNGGAWDYFHGNSIAQDTDGNLLISARNTWGVYKVNVKTGRSMWQVGAKGDPRLGVPWCYQHDVTALGAGNYSMFDDGSIGPSCYPKKTWHPARGLVFHVDSAHRPVRVSLVSSYSHHPSIYAEFTGGMQELPDGGAIVDWGYIPEITQYSRGGHVVMDLALSAQSYRGGRFSWTGTPSTSPVAAARLRSGGTQVWASWNGSTEVHAWRVLGGATSGGLSVVAPSVPMAGFETGVFLKQAYPFVAVQALSAAGKVLATSKPISTALGAG